MRLFRTALLCTLFLASVCSYGQTVYPIETNQSWDNGPYGTSQTLKIATLPTSSGGTGDHLRLIATVNVNNYSQQNAYIDASFANRNGFNWFYTVHGYLVSACSHLMAYQNIDGTTDIYLQLSGQCFDVGSYSIIDNFQVGVYDHPTDIGNSTPPGTLVFDSADPATYPPQNTINYFGNMGIGTATPQSELSIVTGNPTTETGEHISNTEANGYSVLRLGTDNIASQGGALHQFNSLWPDDPASASAPLSTSLMAFEAGGLNLSANNSAGFTRFFTGGGAAGNERMRIDPSGNVGIGTTTPGAKLEVNGNIKLTSTGQGIVFPDGSTMTSAQSVGSNGSSTIEGPAGSSLVVKSDAPAGQSQGAATVVLETAARTWGVTLWNSGNGGDLAGGVGFVDATAGQLRTLFDAAGNLYFGMKNNDASAQSSSLAILASGNVGINTATPGADLSTLSSPPASTTPIFEVNGDIALVQHGGGQVIFPDGTVQATAWNGTTLGGDYAESVDVVGGKNSYEAGDVIVIDENATGLFKKSQQAYSNLVAGVYSTKPGLVGRRVEAARPNQSAEVPMALMGIVPTKVCTENGPIKRGDLLVSSSRPGYAMRGTDRDRLTGAIIGKALEPLNSDSGTIEVLLAMQ